VLRSALFPAAASPAEINDFYKTVSAICFTLLGLWWVVGQVRFREWMDDRRRRRRAYAVSLYFLLPGVMTLLASINSGVSLLWRLPFVVIGVVGVLEVVLYVAAPHIRTRGDTVLRGFSLVLYGLIAIFAVHPTLAADLGLGLAPREAEAILISLVLVVGVNLAWFGLVEPGESAPE
jgi:hypothetical protein